MDGPVFIHAAWFLCAIWIWIYDRYFATVAARSPEFESYARRRPLLARLTVTADAAALAERLKAELGPRAEVIPTLGGWPWTHHVLKVEVRPTATSLELTLVACRVLRRRERPLPTLTDLLLDFTAKAGGDVEDCWLCPDAFYDVSGIERSENGWRLLPDAPRRRPVEPWGRQDSEGEAREVTGRAVIHCSAHAG